MSATPFLCVLNCWLRALLTVGFFNLVMPLGAQDKVPSSGIAVAAPEFPIPNSQAAWDRQRTEIRATLWRLLGDLPPRPSHPKSSLVKREESDGCILERLTIDNGAGEQIPACLLLPKSASSKRPVPAILYCHWHGGEYDIGKEELFRRDHTPEPPGPALVKRGYAVLAIDAPCFGERNGRGPAGAPEKGAAGEMTASKYHLWLGRSLWGMILRDDLTALDFLSSRPEIDPQRIGVTGMSMGATRSWWLMALDDRLKSGVAVACLTRYEDLIAAQGLKHHGIYYFVPGMLRHFDAEAVVALAAPRPLLCLNGDHDDGSPAEGIARIDSIVSRIYSLSGNGARFESRVYPGVGHQYTPDMWSRMLAWFERDLKP